MVGNVSDTQCTAKYLIIILQEAIDFVRAFPFISIFAFILFEDKPGD
jgi:hypothetical protein